MKTLRIRDGRQGRFFIIDNELIDVYLPKVGVHAFAVYCVLVRSANRSTAECSLFINEIATAVGVERRSIERWLRALESVRLVTTLSGKSKGEKNVYVLLDVPKQTAKVETPLFDALEGTTVDDNLVSTVAPPCDSPDRGCDSGVVQIRSKNNIKSKPSAAVDTAAGETPLPALVSMKAITDYACSSWEKNNPGIARPEFTPFAGVRFAKQMKKYSRWSFANWKQAFDNYFSSDDVNPADDFETLILRVPSYISGLKNTFHQLKGKNDEPKTETFDERRSKNIDRNFDEADRRIRARYANSPESADLEAAEADLSNNPLRTAGGGD